MTERNECAHTVTEDVTTAGLTVSGLRARAVEIPLDTPIETAGGTIGTSPLVLVDLLTQEGVTGSTYIFCYTRLVLAPLVSLLTVLADALRGQPAAPAALAHTLASRFRLLGSTGLVGMAMAGIDMAAWDAVARAESRSLGDLFGTTVHSVPAYASVRSMRPDEAAREAAAAVDGGFRAIKIKLGHASLHADLRVVREVRQAVGDRVEVMVDYNQSLSPDESLRRARALDDEGLAWIEEPVDASDDAGHARVAGEIETPIQVGENWWGWREMARSLTAGAMDLATFDAARIGGVTGWRQAAEVARQQGLRVSSHRYPEVSVSLLAATPTRHWLEYVDTVRPILLHPVRLENGDALVPSETGAGIAWDEQAVERFLVP